ncbi:hypothetical protein BHM03_00002923 [Ensete ventricosum]|nr:hypothetical protein BHM03_00002923 [Ensete ventricosum]
MADAPQTLIDGSTMAALSLARAGVQHMFGVVGIPVTAVATRAVAAGVRFLAFHNEQSAGYAATAYGYLTGRPGVFLTVSGPGCVHGLAGLSNAAINAWPAVMISGSCDQADAGKGDFQELDQIEAVKPFVKFSAKATHISQIPRLVYQVLSQAVAGRPGGCYLDLPSDVLHQTISDSEADKILSEAENPRIEEITDKEVLDIEKAVSLLRSAERPLIVFGKGAAFARAEEPLKKLIETTGIPFLPTPMGKGLVPDTHELAATAARSLAIGQCDVALIVGARLNWLLHFGQPPRWSKDVKFILVDISTEEIELRKPHLGLVGDAKRVVELINKEIKDQPFCLGRSHPWVEAISKKAKDNVAKMEVQLSKDVVPFNFFTPMRIIRDAILSVGSPAPILVSEGANTMDVGRAVLVQNEPRTRLDAGTWGTMGVGLGYCIAAAVASPERLVVAVEGDSGFGFSAMEVEESWRVKPHPRKGDLAALSRVTEMSVGYLSNNEDVPKCDIKSSVPAIIFATGGYMGNFFHETTDLIIPLYITSHKFNGEVQFLISDMLPWWITKYELLLKKLSHYEIIDFNRDPLVRCYPRVIVGISFHRDMSIDPARSGGVTMFDFGQFIRSTYSLKRERAIKLGANQDKKPRLLIIARKRTRRFTNVDEIARMAEWEGFEPVVAEIKENQSLVEFARIVNSCDAMLGVHGAGLTNLIFLPTSAVVIQVVPLGGLETFCWTDYGVPTLEMKMRYLQYSISIAESSLIDRYGITNPVVTNPKVVLDQKDGWRNWTSIYFFNQDVKLDVGRFSSVLVHARELLHQ